MDEQGARRGECLNVLTPSGSRVEPEQWTRGSDSSGVAATDESLELRPDSSVMPLRFRDGGDG